eukprot:3989972-Prymnesium_polylepis.1
MASLDDLATAAAATETVEPADADDAAHFARRGGGGVRRRRARRGGAARGERGDLQGQGARDRGAARARRQRGARCHPAEGTRAAGDGCHTVHSCDAVH